jgi:hypothetical protein
VACLFKNLAGETKDLKKKKREEEWSGGVVKGRAREDATKGLCLGV